MPKDTTNDDLIIDDSIDNLEKSLDTESSSEDKEVDILPEDVKEALGLDENGEVKPKIKGPKGKAPVKEVTPISEWLPEDDAKAMQTFNDSLY